MANETTKTTDLAPVQSLDFATRFGYSTKQLMKLLGLYNITKMAVGNKIVAYKYEVSGTVPTGVVAEGEVIPKTVVKKTKVWEKEVEYKKYRKGTTSEAIDALGDATAIGKTDEVLMNKAQTVIRTELINVLKQGTLKSARRDVKGALSFIPGALLNAHKGEGGIPIVFINPLDTEGLFNGVTMNSTASTAYGLSIYTDVLGVNIVLDPYVEQGTVYATVAENLNAYVAPQTSNKFFGATTDESGFVSIYHTPKNETDEIETNVKTGFMIFPENLDYVAVVKIDKTVVA